jgi:hypothetical protein
MIKKLICLIWGHKFMLKARTGNSAEVIGALGNVFTIVDFVWVPQKNCPRCGTPNPHLVKSSEQDK